MNPEQSPVCGQACSGHRIARRLASAGSPWRGQSARVVDRKMIASAPVAPLWRRCARGNADGESCVSRLATATAPYLPCVARPFSTPGLCSPPQSHTWVRLGFLPRLGVGSRSRSLCFIYIYPLLRYVLFERALSVTRFLSGCILRIRPEGECEAVQLGTQHVAYLSATCSYASVAYGSRYRCKRYSAHTFVFAW